jgi:hypothetical protein
VKSSPDSTCCKHYIILYSLFNKPSYTDEIQMNSGKIKHLINL